MKVLTAGRGSSAAVLATASLAAATAFLDTGIVNLALPALGKAFMTTASGLAWTVNAYVLPFAVSILAVGRLGDWFGRRRVLAAGAAVFAVGSAGAAPPEGFNYELFLDDKGQKISKSKGNGLTIDEWLRYAGPESLSLFMYREPKAAKRLYFDVIPRNVDDYQQYLEAYRRQDAQQRLSNPLWHVHAGHPPDPEISLSFSMLLALVSSSNAENAETLWGFIGRCRAGVTPQTHPRLDAMVRYAINYFHDFVLPTKKFREPDAAERAALMDLRDALAQLRPEASAVQIQDVVYEMGRREPFLDKSGKVNPKDGKPRVSLEWFNMLYQVLLGQEKGPRFGSFVAIYGVQNTIDMIDGVLARSA